MKKGDMVSFYTLDQQIGDGGFGDVWKVKSTENDEMYAMKLEPISSKRRTLSFEASILKKLQNFERFPRYILDGTDGDYHFLVMELLGPNLSQVASNMPNRSFSLEYIPKLFDEMLYCLESFHQIGYIHRDIKPQNFVVRHTGRSAICLLDYGISKVYVDHKGEHLEAREHTVAIGSPVFASPNSHNRVELSRRDDLYSLMYSILVLAGKGLPWNANQKIEEMGSAKSQSSLPALMEPLGSPFVEIAKHIESLGFADEPNYQAIHQYLQKNMPQTPAPYEWMTVEVGKPSSTVPYPNDPTGFLVSTAPYLVDEKSGCILL